MQIKIQPAQVWIPNKGGQESFFFDWWHFFLALQGGWMSGKTWIGARKLVWGHCYNAIDEHGNKTGIPSAVVAPTYGNAMDFDVPELQNALNEANIKWRWHGPGSVSNGRYSGPALILPEFSTETMPSVILIRTADKPESITGWQVGLGWGDEPARWKEDRQNPLRDPYTQFMGRVRHPKARINQLFFTYTNEGDGTRIYDEFKSSKPDHAIYTASTRENASASDFVERQMQNLTADLISQYIEGGAISLKGDKIYSIFDKNANVDSSIALRKDLPLQLSLDFNISPGMHAEIGHYDEIYDMFGTVYEIHEKRLDVRGVCDIFGRLIKELGGWQWPELQIFGDASGGSGWAGTGETCYQILMQGLKELEKQLNCRIPIRVRVPNQNPFVEDRFNSFNVALKDISGVVHWKCHPRCEKLIQDLEQMKRDENGEVEKQDRKLSHASDAEGYRVNFLRPARIKTIGIGGRFGV